MSHVNGKKVNNLLSPLISTNIDTPEQRRMCCNDPNKSDKKNIVKFLFLLNFKQWGKGGVGGLSCCIVQFDLVTILRTPVPYRDKRSLDISGIFSSRKLGEMKTTFLCLAISCGILLVQARSHVRLVLFIINDISYLFFGSRIL